MKNDLPKSCFNSKNEILRPNLSKEKYFPSNSSNPEKSKSQIKQSDFKQQTIDQLLAQIKQHYLQYEKLKKQNENIYLKYQQLQLQYSNITQQVQRLVSQQKVAEINHNSIISHLIDSNKNQISQLKAEQQNAIYKMQKDYILIKQVQTNYIKLSQYSLKVQQLNKKYQQLSKKMINNIENQKNQNQKVIIQHQLFIQNLKKDYQQKLKNIEIENQNQFIQLNAQYQNKLKLQIQSLNKKIVSKDSQLDKLKIKVIEIQSQLQQKQNKLKIISIQTKNQTILFKKQKQKYEKNELLIKKYQSQINQKDRLFKEVHQKDKIFFEDNLSKLRLQIKCLSEKNQMLKKKIHQKNIQLQKTQSQHQKQLIEIIASKQKIYKQKQAQKHNKNIYKPTLFKKNIESQFLIQSEIIQERSQQSSTASQILLNKKDILRKIQYLEKQNSNLNNQIQVIQTTNISLRQQLRQALSRANKQKQLYAEVGILRAKVKSTQKRQLILSKSQEKLMQIRSSYRIGGYFDRERSKNNSLSQQNNNLQEKRIDYKYTKISTNNQNKNYQGRAKEKTHQKTNSNLTFNEFDKNQEEKKLFVNVNSKNIIAKLGIQKNDTLGSYLNGRYFINKNPEENIYDYQNFSKQTKKNVNISNDYPTPQRSNNISSQESITPYLKGSKDIKQISKRENDTFRKTSYSYKVQKDYDISQSITPICLDKLQDSSNSFASIQNYKKASQNGTIIDKLKITKLDSLNYMQDSINKMQKSIVQKI